MIRLSHLAQIFRRVIVCTIDASSSKLSQSVEASASEVPQSVASSSMEASASELRVGVVVGATDGSKCDC